MCCSIEFIKLCKKVIICLAKLTFDLFSKTCLINPIPETYNLVLEMHYLFNDDS